MNIDDIKRALEPLAKGDEPRKVVVCHPDIYPDVQRAVIELGHGDVLVQPNNLVGADVVYIVDGALLRPTFDLSGGTQSDESARR